MFIRRSDEIASNLENSKYKIQQHQKVPNIEISNKIKINYVIFF